MGSDLQSPDHVREVYVARTNSIEQCAGILCNPLSRQVPPPQKQLERQSLSISRHLARGSTGANRCVVVFQVLLLGVAVRADEPQGRWATAVCAEPWRQVASPDAMSPTIFREGPYRFYFFSR